MQSASFLAFSEKNDRILRVWPTLSDYQSLIGGLLAIAFQFAAERFAERRSLACVIGKDIIRR